MRKHIQNRLKEYFRFTLLQSRDELGLSQEKMAHRLEMATHSYIDLENGTSCCSAVTFVLYLLYIYPDPTAFWTNCVKLWKLTGRLHERGC